jgi:hypothetical protein
MAKKVTWRFTPRIYKTKKKAKEVGEATKKKFGYLYRVSKTKKGYKLYIMAAV